MSQACVRVARGATTTLSRVLADVDLDPRLNGWRLNGWRYNGYRPSAEPLETSGPNALFPNLGGPLAKLL